MKKCTTLQGNIIDPLGLLSTGANTSGGSIFAELSKLKNAQNRLRHQEAILNQRN